MNKYYIVILISLILSCKNTNQTNFKVQNQFSKTDVLSDLEFLKTSLENTHINLYAYTSKSEFEENYSKVKHEVKKDSFSILEGVKIFQKVVSKANNGHTRIPFPVQSYISFAQNGGTIFPLEVAIENGKVLIRKNWSKNLGIKIGDELTNINNIPINKILKKIYPQISAERLYFKNVQLENLTLPRFYWLVFGEQITFKVKVIQKGEQSTYRLKSIKAIEEYEMKRDDIIKHDKLLKMLSNNTAYIRPGDFGGNLDKYKQFIDSSFIEIKNKKNLIIDLRNHSGGDDEFGDYLVSYIANKPFLWSSKFQLKTSTLLKEHTRQTKDTTQRYWKYILEHKNGEIYDYDFGFYKPQPIAKRYQGKVYVLVNRQSYSQSTVTTAQIQDHGFGTIVGEETGEYPNLYASIFNYKLPKTGISVDISKGKINRVSGIDNNKGVVPNIIIKDHLLDEKDEILERLLKKIE
ncbi:S41 family peptidase [Aquimarina macrocephali]|uniref:S41 family peptidase n=1 Tax=Aquimarina macrocephali TaxID=666563 RepID=UPI0004B2D9BC|nr:S41 family peptidase [Aquimarina macrocephali]